MPILKRSYSELLRSSRWTAKRAEILKLHNCRCDYCGADDEFDLQVRHAPHGDIAPWDYPNSVYSVECRQCTDFRTRIVLDSLNRLRVLFKEVPNKDLKGLTEMCLSQTSSMCPGGKSI